MATKNAVNNGLDGQEGTGKFVGDNSPSLTTPSIGAATGTSLNLGSSTTMTGMIDDDSFATASPSTTASSESILALVNASSNSGISTLTVVSQGTHNLTVGMVIKGLAAGTYEAAKADSATNAEVVGIVTIVPDNNNFTFISGGQTTTMVGLTANSVYFLDPTTAGLLTLTEPTAAGQISRPVLYTDTTTSGFYLPYRGSVVTDSLPINNAKNLIIGGDFSLNPWQRGTSTAVTVALNGVYTADRFQWYGTGTTAALTYQKTADAPTVAEAGYYSSDCHEVDVTTADAAIAAGDFVAIRYNVEGYDYSAIAERQFTLSFWVKAFTAGTYCVSFLNSAENRSYIVEYTINTTATWEKKTITLTGDTAGTWLTDTNGAGLRINFMMAAGSTYQGAADTWQAGALFSTSNQINGVASTSDYLRLQFVQLEAGAVATPFEIRSRADELALCQRYYQKSYDQGVNPAAADVNGSLYMFNLSTTKTQGTARFPVDMRTIPAVAVYSPATGTVGQVRSSAADKAGSATTIGDSGFGSVTCTGLTAAVTAAFHFTASSEL